MPDEYLDIVNEQDEVIGRELRSVIYAEKRTNFRVVNAFLKNDAGQLWIPRRTATKAMFPLCLDCSMGGHVASGETYDVAFARELAEELNIDATKVDWKIIGHCSPYTHSVSAFMTVYEISTNSTPRYNPADFIESYWLHPDEFFARMQNGDTAKSDLPMIVEYFYG